jgi:hypothetical protein
LADYGATLNRNPTMRLLFAAFALDFLRVGIE